MGLDVLAFYCPGNEELLGGVEGLLTVCRPAIRVFRFMNKGFPSYVVARIDDRRRKSGSGALECDVSPRASFLG